MTDRERLLLSQIHPSDLPREDSWIDAHTKVDPDCYVPPINLEEYGIPLMQVGDAVTVPNGNHFLASIWEKCGDCEVSGELMNTNLYWEGQWAYQLQRVEGEGIRTFADFVSQANSGNFNR